MMLLAVVERLPSIADAIRQYGYPVLGAGLLLENAGIPVPGETMLLTAAGLAAVGQLDLAIVGAVALVSAIGGDNVGFALGRVGARRWLFERFPRIIRPATLARADRFFERYGATAVFFARFITGVRVVGAPVAGASSMEWRTFFVANALGAIVWVTAVCAVGYYGVSALGPMHRFFAGWRDHPVTALAAGTGALVVVVLVTKHLLRRRIGESDRPARPRP